MRLSASPTTGRSRDADEAIMARLAQALAEPNRRPRSERLEQTLIEAIRAGALPAGAALPPEPWLAAQLGISRQTLNRALGSAARQGFLVRRRGIGTFVAEPLVVEQPLDALYSIMRTVAAQGRTPGTRLLGARVTQDDLASAFLTGQPNGLVFEASRLRLVDGAPLILEHVFLSTACGERVPAERLTGEVLDEVLREVCGVTITHAEETLRPVVLSRAEAALLGVQPGEAAFLVERLAWAGETPAEARRSVIRGDRWRYRARLAGAALVPELGR